MSAYLFPGQGSQQLKMGEGLFTKFPDLVSLADDLLGYSVASLCTDDPYGQLNNTYFTQPALFVVNALSYLDFQNKAQKKQVDCMLGHSLGEYNALWAAGVFDFETGLRLVQKRAALMAAASGGKMAAVIGLTAEQVDHVLATYPLSALSIANYNSYLQQVLSGPEDLINKAADYFKEAGAKMYRPLAVSGAFHSPLMHNAAKEFYHFLQAFSFYEPDVTVIANANALPYTHEAIQQNLVLHIDHPVQWLQSVRYLLAQGETDFQEIGPGVVLKNLVTRILKDQ